MKQTNSISTNIINILTPWFILTHFKIIKKKSFVILIIKWSLVSCQIKDIHNIKE